MRSAPSMRPWYWISCGCLALLALLAASSLARAHVRSQSFSSWTVREGSVRLVFSVPVLEATRLAASPGPGADLGGLLRAHLASRVPEDNRFGAALLQPLDRPQKWSGDGRAEPPVA